MRLHGALADYPVDYNSATTYLKVESNGLPYWRDDTLLIAFEAHSGVFPNKYDTAASHLVLRIKTDQMCALWMKLVPTFMQDWITPKVSVIANAGQFLRAACLLLRRGLQPINIRLNDDSYTDFFVTADEAELIDNAWNTQVDAHGRLTVRELGVRSEGVITVFEEGFGPLEGHGEQWMTYTDSCLVSVCGSSFYDVVSEYSGQPPDVIMDVLNAVQSALVDGMRMGVSLGLSTMEMRIPFIGRVSGVAFYAQHLKRFKTQVDFVPDGSLQHAIEGVLNVVQPYPFEFGPMVYRTQERMKADGSKEESSTTKEAVTDSREETDHRIVFVNVNGGDPADLLPADESTSSEEVYSDGYDPWDEDDAKFQSEAGQEGID